MRDSTEVATLLVTLKTSNLRTPDMRIPYEDSKLYIVMQKSRQKRQETGSVGKQLAVCQQSRGADAYPPQEEMQVRGTHSIRASVR